jgi:S1-C subfamily serine protease
MISLTYGDIIEEVITMEYPSENTAPENAVPENAVPDSGLVPGNMIDAYPVASEQPTAELNAFPPIVEDSEFHEGFISQRTPPPFRWPIWRTIVAGLLVLALVIGAFVIGRNVSAAKTNSPVQIGSSAPPVSLPANVQDLQQSITATIQAVQPSVVEIKSVVSRGRLAGEATGSGVIISQDGYIVTNDHVVTGTSSLTVTFSDNSTASATVVGESPQNDLAVIKVSKSNLKAISFADSSKVQIGTFAIALGNPLGLDQSATLGIVSALNRTESEGSNGTTGQLSGLIQTSAPINPGNSGGALVNLQGQLIGMPTLGALDNGDGGQAEGIGFAIASNQVKSVAQQIIANPGSSSSSQQSTNQAFLGIDGLDVTPSIASQEGLTVQQGVLVNDFASDANGSSPAQKAGLQVGDVITALDGQQVTGHDSLSQLLSKDSPGKTVTLTIQRGNSQQKIQVTLGTHP